jgi:hypothetical protein
MIGFSSMSLGCCQCCRVAVNCRWVVGDGCRWVVLLVVDITGWSLMSLASRRHRCTVQVDEWLPLSSMGFAVEGLDHSSI